MENLFLYISIILFIISLILLLVQGVFNYYFFRTNDRKIVLERTLYEQFSYEVYSSINTAISKELNVRDSCNSNEVPLDFNLNFDTFYDCRGIFTNDLDEKCKDVIISNTTNCYNSEEIDFSTSYTLPDYDIRNIYCKYFSRFTQKKQLIQGQYICQNKEEEMSYDELLSKSVKFKDYTNNINSCPPDYNNCGILDTKNNILCLKNCPNYILNMDFGTCLKINDNNLCFKSNENYEYKKISVSIIFSENQPLNHEWDKMIKETFEDMSKKNADNRRYSISPDFGLIDEENDNTYELLKTSNYIQIQNILSKIKGFGEDETKKKYNINQNINIYTRPYIGFEDLEELNEFRKIFDDKNYTNNPLYKLSSSGHDPLITIVISCFFICVAIAYLLFLIIKIFQENIFNILKIIFIIILTLFWISELIIIAVHFAKYPQIFINMDSRMKKVLDKYNKRTLMCQIYRIISLSLKTISGAFLIFHIYKNKNQYQQVIN